MSKLQRIELPTKTDSTPLRVKKLKRTGAVVAVLDSGEEFVIPLELLPENIAEGEKLSLKISDTTSDQENHESFARKLLEEIIN